MEWRDEGIVLGRRRHGETSAIVSLFTREHGRHLGRVRGAVGKRAAGIYESGNIVTAAWRGRLAEHLGTLTCELADAIAARVMEDPLRLGALLSACALIETTMAEREPHITLYETTLALFQSLEGRDWAANYVRWEMHALAELGFGLDLSHCAATGQSKDLAYVSPRSGRAVSRDAGVAYADRLFILPPFLIGERSDAPDAQSVLAGLEITGHFLERNVLAANDRAMPVARTQFVDRWRRAISIYGK